MSIVVRVLESQTNKELSKAFKQKYLGKTLIVTP
jgi:hypothetical protein